MTPRKLVRLYCDREHCSRQYTWQLPLGYEGSGLHETRRRAVRSGWFFGEENYADLCPTHANG